MNYLFRIKQKRLWHFYVEVGYCSNKMKNNYNKLSVNSISKNNSKTTKEKIAHGVSLLQQLFISCFLDQRYQNLQSMFANASYVCLKKISISIIISTQYALVKTIRVFYSIILVPKVLLHHSKMWGYHPCMILLLSSLSPASVR